MVWGRSKWEYFQGLHEACVDGKLHIAEWHDGLKSSGKAGMLFKTTALQDDPRREQHSSTPCFHVGCWSQMDYAWISSGIRSMSQNCTPYSARHFALPQTCSTLNTPWNFRGATMAPLSSRTGTKGTVKIFLDEWSLWTKPGLAHKTQTSNGIQMSGSIPVLLVQIKCPLHIVQWRW